MVGEALLALNIHGEKNTSGHEGHFRGDRRFVIGITRGAVDKIDRYRVV